MGPAHLLLILNIENELMVRKERLELSHLSVLEPKSSASTNSATFAHVIEIADVDDFFELST